MISLIGQSGGPTSVINASLAGAISKSIELGYDKILGLKNGIVGLLEDRIVEIDKKKYIDQGIEEKLLQRPSSILGSCRYKLPEDLDDPIYPLIFEKLNNLGVSDFIYIGGNDSMDTVSKLSKYALIHEIKNINFVGSPKTIDNDLMLMDHSPGFGSCAKYIAGQMKNIRMDCDIYPIKSVTVVEIMGRNAGWLSASALLANNEDKEVVNLLLLAEKSISKEEIIKLIKEKFEYENNILIAVSEGFMDKDNYFNSIENKSHDQGFAHPILTGVGKKISDYIGKELGIKTKNVELNILQRSNYLSSLVDAREAFTLGAKSVELSNMGLSGVLPILERKLTSTYEVQYSYVGIDEIANKEKVIPKDWLKDYYTLDKNIKEYALPLIQGQVNVDYIEGIPYFVKLESFIK